MKIPYLLFSSLLLSATQVVAEELDALAARRDQLRQEIEHLRQTTRDERARLDALKQLIETQREQNRLLDQQLQNHPLPAGSGAVKNR